MKKQLLKIGETALKAKNKVMYDEHGGISIGVAIVLSIVVTIIIFALIIIPEGKTFSNTLFDNLTDWYTNLNIFQTS